MVDVAVDDVVASVVVVGPTTRKRQFYYKINAEAEQIQIVKFVISPNIALNNIKPKHYVLQNTVELVRVIDDLQYVLFEFIRTGAKWLFLTEKRLKALMT